MKLKEPKPELFDHFPVQEFATVRLREIHEGDALGLLDYLSDERVRKYIAIEDLPNCIEDAEREVLYWGSLFRNKHSIYWGIAEKETDTIIGTCGFNCWNRNHYKAEVSYDLAHAYWNKGITSEILSFIISYGFHEMGLNRISAKVTTNNVGSIRVLEKNDFQHEGLLRAYKMISGEIHDAHIYSIIAKEFFSKN